MKLHVESDRTLIRSAASSTRYVRVAFTAPEARRRASRTPVNIALVLDRSGSMAGGKLDLARQAAERALALLQPDDRFSVVVYDDRVDLITPASPATQAERTRAADRLSRIEPRGSTDLCSGWLTGCEQVGREVSEESVGRCLLLTDGLANHGITDSHELTRHAGELRARGVVTSTFGVGADFDERLLQAMAEAGAGNSYYLRDAEQISEFLESEIGEALEVVARGAALVVRLPEGATAEPLGRQRVVRSGSSIRIELEDLVSEQKVELVVAVRFPGGREGSRAVAQFSLEDRGGALEAGDESLSWTYASHAENDRQPRTVAVDRVVARFYAARARAEAVDLNRDGDLEGARKVLRRTAERIRSYASGDRELLDVARELERDSERYAEMVLSAPALK
ncbi:MAG: vWA domain-containing protein, partial [Gemmatimonadales bacterium]